MENKIPLPTDSIYKFYALFGLALFIFGFWILIHIGDSTNEFIFSISTEKATLEAIEKPTPLDIAKKKIIEKRSEIAISNSGTFSFLSGCASGIGIFLMFYGFRKWHTEIQPIQDKTARLQLEKLELEVAKMRIPTTNPNTNDDVV